MKKTPSKRALRSDHKLIKEVKSILNKQAAVCEAMSKEVGFDCGWSDLQELADGVSPYRLWQMGQ